MYLYSSMTNLIATLLKGLKMKKFILKRFCSRSSVNDNGLLMSFNQGKQREEMERGSVQCRYTQTAFALGSRFHLSDVISPSHPPSKGQYTAIVRWRRLFKSSVTFEIDVSTFRYLFRWIFVTKCVDW